jgi:hypothetical protein
MRSLHPIVRRCVLSTLACGAFLGVASVLRAQDAHPLRTHVQVVVHETGVTTTPFVRTATVDEGGERWPETAVARQGGTLYLAIRGAGVMVLDGAAPVRWLVDRSGARELSGDLGWIGDTLAVSDWNSWRLFGAGGKPLGCRTFEAAHNEFATQVFPLRPLAGGLVVGELTPAYPGRIGKELVVSRDQDVRRTLYRAPPEPPDIEVPDPDSSAVSEVRPPLDADTIWSAATNGSGVAVVEQLSPRMGGTYDVSVLRMAMDGSTVFRTRVRVPVLPASQAWVERQYAGEVRAINGHSTIVRDSAAIVSEFRRHAPYPPYHPPVTDVLAGDDGSVWLRLASESDLVTWIALGRDGRERGRAAVPSDFFPSFADESGMWGARRTAPDRLEVLVVTAGAPPLGQPRIVEAEHHTPRQITLQPCRQG